MLAFHADADETTLHLTIQDDGTGYPQSVLAVLNGEPEGESAPHILGLHVVEQIINAHDGSGAVCQPGPPRCKSDDAAATDQRRKRKNNTQKQIPPPGKALCSTARRGIVMLC